MWQSRVENEHYSENYILKEARLNFASRLAVDQVHVRSFPHTIVPHDISGSVSC